MFTAPLCFWSRGSRRHVPTKLNASRFGHLSTRSFVIYLLRAVFRTPANFGNLCAMYVV